MTTPAPPEDIVKWLRKEARECEGSIHTHWVDPDRLDEAAAEIERLRGTLLRARTILENMARENPPRIEFAYRRWPISHEPLRADAKRLLPDIDSALAGREGT